MKKILYFITVLTMAVFILTACRKNDATVYFASENTQADNDEDISHQSTENSDTSVKESSSENEDPALKLWFMSVEKSMIQVSIISPIKAVFVML